MNTPAKEHAMFERLSDRARKVMALANQQAQRHNHDYIAPEHLLLGLLQEGSGVAAHVLKSMDFDLQKIAQHTEALLTTGPDASTSHRIPQVPAAKQVIENAIAESRSLNHNYVGTEHLLLALLRPADPPTIPNRVFQQLDLTRDAVREATISLIGHGVGSSPSENFVPTHVTHHQSLVYQGAVTLLSRRYIAPLQPDQIAECIRDAQAILKQVTTSVPP